MSVDCGDNLFFKGHSNVAFYDSSASAERGFCKNCGTHLFYRDKNSGVYYVPVGCFERAEEFELVHQVFSEDKPGYYCLSS